MEMGGPRPPISRRSRIQGGDALLMQRKLAAILSADVKGYSRLMGDDEAATVRTLTEYREVIASTVARHGGRVVDAPGDNVLAEFSSVVDAVQGAIEIQHTLGSRNAALPDARRMQFRIGINLGDVIVEEQRLYGDGVNIAARVESLAEGGGICLSGTAYDQVEGKLPVGTTSWVSRPSRTSLDRCACIGSVSSPMPRHCPCMANGDQTDGEFSAWPG